MTFETIELLVNIMFGSCAISLAMAYVHLFTDNEVTYKLTVSLLYVSIVDVFITMVIYFFYQNSF